MNGPTVKSIVSKFLKSRLAEGGLDRERFYAKHLKRFVSRFGGRACDEVRPYDVQVLKEALLGQGYAPKTINHDLTSIATLFRWASDLELITSRRLVIRKLPLPALLNKAMDTPAEVRDYVLHERAGDACKIDSDFYIVACLAISYLTAARPMEIVRLITRQGTWIDRGVLQLPNKMGWRSRIPRHLLFSDEALDYYEVIRNVPPRWTKLYTYSRGIVRKRGRGPHRLRHSAATHLRKLYRVGRTEVDLILGHYPPESSWTYFEEDWQSLRTLASSLTLTRQEEAGQQRSSPSS